MNCGGGANGGGGGFGGFGGGGEGGIVRLLQQVLDRAPELRLFVTSTEPVSLPGVQSRQVVLGSMPARGAGKLFKALAPRPISRAEVGCGDPRELKAEHACSTIAQDRAPGGL